MLRADWTAMPVASAICFYVVGSSESSHFSIRGLSGSRITCPLFGSLAAVNDLGGTFNGRGTVGFFSDAPDVAGFLGIPLFFFLLEQTDQFTDH